MGAAFLWHRVGMNFSRRSWYLLAILVPLIAWIIGSAQLASRWDSVHDAKPIALGGNFDAYGQSVAVFTDFPQPDRIVECSVTKPNEFAGKISTPPVEIAVDYDATRWHLIAIAEEGQDKMAITCAAADGHTDGATYAYAVIPTDFEAKTSAKFIVWGGLAFGFFISVVIGYNRFRELKRSE